MINLIKPIDIEVSHSYIREYRIDGLNLIEDGSDTVTFKNYAEMAKYLGMTRQGLYNKIRKNMSLIDMLAEKIKFEKDYR